MSTECRFGETLTGLHRVRGWYYLSSFAEFVKILRSKTNFV